MIDRKKAKLISAERPQWQKWSCLCLVLALTICSAMNDFLYTRAVAVNRLPSNPVFAWVFQLELTPYINVWHLALTMEHWGQCNLVNPSFTSDCVYLQWGGNIDLLRYWSLIIQSSGHAIHSRMLPGEQWKEKSYWSFINKFKPLQYSEGRF